MASRFEVVDEEYIEELNENTKKSTEYWKNVFKMWANERNFQANLEEYESDVLDQTLSQLTHKVPICIFQITMTVTWSPFVDFGCVEPWLRRRRGGSVVWVPALLSSPRRFLGQVL